MTYHINSLGCASSYEIISLKYFFLDQNLFLAFLISVILSENSSGRKFPSASYQGKVDFIKPILLYYPVLVIFQQPSFPSAKSIAENSYLRSN